MSLYHESDPEYLDVPQPDIRPTKRMTHMQWREMYQGFHEYFRHGINHEKRPFHFDSKLNHSVEQTLSEVVAIIMEGLEPDQQRLHEYKEDVEKLQKFIDDQARELYELKQELHKLQQLIHPPKSFFRRAIQVLKLAAKH